MATIVEHLKKDHVRIKELFAAYENDPETHFPELKKLLDAHTYIEETSIYPLSMSFAADVVEHAQEEHNAAKDLLRQLEIDPTNMDTFNQLRQDVEHHAEEEEKEFFPLVEQHMSQEQMEQLDEEADKHKA